MSAPVIIGEVASVVSLVDAIIKNVHVSEDGLTLIITFENLSSVVNFEKNTISLDIDSIPIITEPLITKSCLRQCWNSFKKLFTGCNCYKACPITNLSKS